MTKRVNRNHVGWWFAASVLGLAMVPGCSREVAVNSPPPDMVKALELREQLAKASGDAEESDAGPAAGPKGFATLRGRFVLDGAAPAAAALAVDKDMEVCAPGGKSVFSEALVVDDASKGIKDVLIYAEGVPADWCHETAAPGKKTEPVVFDQKNCIFLTHVTALQASQPLKILNSDPIGHNTNMKPASNPPLNSLIPKEGLVYQPKTAERQPFEANCSIHPWMSAWIMVRDNGYFAVTKPDGTFEISNLPAGVPIELKVWQEKAKFLSKVTLNDGSGEKPATWKRGSYAVTLEPDQTLEIEVKVPASTFQ